MRWCLLFALAASAAAQTGSISGVVRDGTTGAPVADCIVSAPNGTTRTSSDGSFTFNSVAPGLVNLSAHNPNGAATRSIRLQAGQKLSNIDFILRLRSISSVSGRVLDANGDPMAGVKVGLRRREYEAGILRYRPNGDVATDKDGKYELKSLDPERSYLLEVYPAATGDDDPGDAKDRPLELPHTYYPGTTHVEDALAITVGANEPRPGMDIRVRKLPTYCIDGTVEVMGQLSAVQYTVEAEDQQGRVLRTADSGMSGHDGKFRNCHLFAGTYRVGPGNATQNDWGRLGGGIEVTIRDADVHDVRLAAQPVPPVTFEWAWDSDPPDPKPALPRAGIEVSNLDDSIHNMFAAAAVEGQLDSSRLPSADFIIRVRTLPPGLYLKDLLINGVSSVRQPLITWNAILGGVRVKMVIGHDGGSIAGVAADLNGTVAPNVNVVFVPETAAGANDLATLISTTVADQDGAFQSATLAPGKYFVIATSSPILPTPECMEKLWQARSGAPEAEVQAHNAAAVKVVPRVLE